MDGTGQHPVFVWEPEFDTERRVRVDTIFVTREFNRRTVEFCLNEFRPI